jgi:hypothetical protein
MQADPRGGRPCRNFTLRTKSAAKPQAYSIRAQVPPKLFGIHNGGFKEGVGSVSDGSCFCRVLLACQNDLPITPDDAAYLWERVAAVLSQRRQIKVPSWGGLAELMEG